MPSRQEGDEDFLADRRPFCTGASIKCMFDIISDVEGEEGAAYVIPRSKEIDEHIQLNGSLGDSLMDKHKKVRNRLTN